MLVSGIDLDVMTKHQRLHDGEAWHRQECHSGALHPQLQAARNHHGQATAARYQIDYGDLHGFVHCLAYQKQAHSDTSHAVPPLQHILSTCLSVLGGFQMLLLHMKTEASRCMIRKRRTATTKQRWAAAEASVVTSAVTFGAKTSSATKTSSRVGSTVATFR